MKAQDYIVARKTIFNQCKVDYPRRTAALAQLKLRAEDEFRQDYKNVIETICKNLPTKTYTWVINGSYKSRLNVNIPPIHLSKHIRFGSLLKELCNHPIRSVPLHKEKQKLNDIRLKLWFLLTQSNPKAPETIYY